MRLGVRTKLFFISLGMIVLTVVVAYAYMRPRLSRAIIDNIRTDLNVRASLVAARAGIAKAPLDDLAAWDALANDLGRRGEARVTLIRTDGVVIGDSRVSLERLPSLQNHGNRPEVRQALADGEGASRRYSATLEKRMMYVATPFYRDGRRVGVARVALPLTQVDAAVAQLRGILTVASLLALLVAVAMSTVSAQLASRTARSLTEAARRMARGDLEVRTGVVGRDELGELARTLDQLAKNLSETLGELRSERDRLSGILDGMQEGVLLLDGEGRVALVNPALREMLLLGADTAGKTPLEVIRHSELKELLDRAVQSEEPNAREIEMTGLKPRRLLVRAAPMPGAQGGVFAVFVDVTEMRRLESVRRDFVANVSHELRTPVTAIRSAAETLEEAVSADPAAAERFVGMISRNAERLQGLVEDLLDLSRIESRELKLRMEPIDVAAAFDHVIELFRQKAEERAVDLRRDPSIQGTSVLADRRALEHVLTNLVDNAVKYAGSGATVTLGAEQNTTSVRLLVADTGPGIEDQHLGRLFERFYRVDAGRSRELGGTGLGLSIVKHLCESMGGTVGVESTPGQGTTFSVSLRNGAVDEASAAAHDEGD